MLYKCYIKCYKYSTSYRPQRTQRQRNEQLLRFLYQSEFLYSNFFITQEMDPTCFWTFKSTHICVLIVIKKYLFKHTFNTLYTHAAEYIQIININISILVWYEELFIPQLIFMNYSLGTWLISCSNHVN